MAEINSLATAQLLDQIYDSSLELFNNNQNGAHPYDEYALLYNLVSQYHPQLVLEAGTGYGLTAVTISLASDTTTVISLDKNPGVLSIAQEYINKYQLSDRIRLEQAEFKMYLAKVPGNTYDMVFFDGFAPGLSVFLELERVLKVGGLMVCANLKLRGDRKKISARMSSDELYSDTVVGEDTIYGVKKF